MQKILKYILIFAAGAVGYSFIEILWRGYTHFSMGIVGGLCLCVLYLFNSKLKCGILIKSLLGCAAITAIELTAGIILNIILHLNVWDYSRMPYNFIGQVCLTYSFYWFVLCLSFYTIIYIYNIAKKVAVKKNFFTAPNLRR